MQHSKQEHLYALLRAAKEYKVPKVFIHFFGDGRDTDPKSGAGYMQELVDYLKEVGVGQIATVVGRYFAMDRDKRWERVEIALKGMCHGEGEASEDPVATVRALYERGGDNDRDEFLKPIIVGGDEGRIKGKYFMQLTELCPGVALDVLINALFQMMILSSSSTTAPTGHGRSPSCSVMSIDPSCPISSTPRSTNSSP